MTRVVKYYSDLLPGDVLVGSSGTTALVLAVDKTNLIEESRDEAHMSRICVLYMCKYYEKIIIDWRGFYSTVDGGGWVSIAS